MRGGGDLHGLCSSRSGGRVLGRGGLSAPGGSIQSRVMANDPQRRVQTGGDVATKREQKAERARRWQVVFHNDDYTTKWFVVEVLERYFHMSETTATAFMLVVHT